jgi:hypothetical protein
MLFLLGYILGRYNVVEWNQLGAYFLPSWDVERCWASTPGCSVSRNFRKTDLDVSLQCLSRSRLVCFVARQPPRVMDD